jgi:hypothetical protein
VRRREFITLLGSATATWPLATRAQERVRRIGVLLPATSDDPEYQALIGAFLQGLALLGWTRSVAICESTPAGPELGLITCIRRRRS